MRALWTHAWKVARRGCRAPAKALSPRLPLSPAEVIGHRLERGRDVAPLDLAPLAPSRTDPTITSKASAPSGGPVSILWTSLSCQWCQAGAPTPRLPFPARRRSARCPSGRGWPPRRPGQSPGRACAAGGPPPAWAPHGLPAARPGRPPRTPGPAPSHAQRGPEAWGCASWQAAGTRSRPHRGENRVGTRRAETTRDASASIDPRTSSRPGNRETSRDDPRAPAPTLNPKVEGSNPSRPIRLANAFLALWIGGSGESSNPRGPGGDGAAAIA